MLLCSACRKTKPIDEFNKNGGIARGRDTYCKLCRASYYKNGRTWPDANERAKARLSRGVWVCGKCRQEKPIDSFHHCTGYTHGISRYCKDCVKEMRKLTAPKYQVRMKAYRSRPEVIARNKRARAATPRSTLAISLNRALKRRPTVNPITRQELFGMWELQKGRCVVSGIEMTWGSGGGPGKMNPTSITIDRIDSSGGYTCDNVRLVCYQVNTFKGQWDDTKMLSMAKTIIANMESVAPVAGLLSLVT